MAGAKGRSGGARPGSGRPKGSRNRATIERDGWIAKLSKDVAELLQHANSERQMRRNEYEAAPAILRRLTAIEKHLHLREEHKFQRHQPRRERAFNAPASAAEALFKPSSS